jgi:hypothetical protein
MSKSFHKISCIIAAMVFILITITASSVFAKPKGYSNKTPCEKAYWACINKCKGPFAPGRNESQCTLQCDSALINCKDAPKKEGVAASMENPAKGQTKTPERTTTGNLGKKEFSGNTSNNTMDHSNQGRRGKH